MPNSAVLVSDVASNLEYRQWASVSLRPQVVELSIADKSFIEKLFTSVSHTQRLVYIPDTFMPFETISFTSSFTNLRMSLSFSPAYGIH